MKAGMIHSLKVELTGRQSTVPVNGLVVGTTKHNVQSDLKKREVKNTRNSFAHNRRIPLKVAHSACETSQNARKIPICRESSRVVPLIKVRPLSYETVFRR
jgi:hypothetical protein